MKFGPMALDECEGQILAHNVSDDTGRRVLRKGKVLDPGAVERLRSLGYETVFVARLEAGDVHEDAAATKIARIVAGEGAKPGPAHTGRVNISASQLGVVRVRSEALLRLNEIEGVTVATLPTHAVVQPGQRSATVKVIPYAIPEEAVSSADALSETGGIVSVSAIERQAVAVVLVGSRGAWTSLREGLGAAVRTRIESLGCFVSDVLVVPTDDGSLAEALKTQAAAGVAMIVVAGETAIMDLDDLIPRAVRRSGGRIEQFGLPMDPGHLLLLGYLGPVPVVGAPGCVRGTAPDGFDAVVPRLLAGERLTGADLRAFGHGGLLSDPRRR